MWESRSHISVIDTKENTLAAYQKIAEALYGQTIYGRVSLIDLRNPSRALEVICLKQDEQAIEALIKKTMADSPATLLKQTGKDRATFQVSFSGLEDNLTAAREFNNALINQKIDLAEVLINAYPTRFAMLRKTREEVLEETLRKTNGGITQMTIKPRL